MEAVNGGTGESRDDRIETLSKAIRIKTVKIQVTGARHIGDGIFFCSRTFVLMVLWQLGRVRTHGS